MKNIAFNAAFTAAFSTHVGGSDNQSITSFIEQIDANVEADLTHLTLGPEYPALMDAWEMFKAGVAFTKHQTFEPNQQEHLDVADALQGMIEVFGDEFGMGESQTVDAARQALVAIGYVHPSVRLPAASTTDIKIDIGQLCKRDDDTAGTVSAVEKITPDQEKQIATAIFDTLVAHGVIATDANVTWPMLLLALHDFKNSAPNKARPAANEIKVETVKLPAYWASALVNNDFSGLDDEEVKNVNEWIAAHPEYGSCHSASDAVVTEKFNGLTCDVLEFSFPVKAQAS